MLSSFRRAFTTSRIMFNNNTANYQARVFVGSLPWRCDRYHLQETFSKYGTVADCYIVSDPQTGRSRGFGFIQFEEVEQAEKAIAEGNGMEFEGRSLLVQPCNAPKNRDQA